MFETDSLSTEGGALVLNVLSGPLSVPSEFAANTA